MRTQWSLSVWWGRSSGGTLLPRWNADYKNKPQNKQKLSFLTCQDCSFISSLRGALMVTSMSDSPSILCKPITIFVVLVFLFLNCPPYIMSKSCQVFPTDILLDVSSGGYGQMGVGRCGATCGWGSLTSTNHDEYYQLVLSGQQVMREFQAGSCITSIFFVLCQIDDDNRCDHDEKSQGR